MQSFIQLYRISKSVAILVAVLLSSVALDKGLLAQSFPPSQLPTIRMARATWDTGWFQAEVVKQLLETLGYVVDGPQTFGNEEFYAAVALGEIDLWVNGWFPLHNDYVVETTAQNHVEIVGTQVEKGALQGYQVDLLSANELNITSLADFTRPEVVEVFDHNGDGRAELIGCNVGWACAEIIEHHLDAYGLRETVEHVQGDYGPLMLDAIERFAQGEPLLLYTWTPNWTVGALVPGEDVLWIGTPFPSLPEGQQDLVEATMVPDVTGCALSPCPLGFPPNDIRTVANRQFLVANPAVRVLLEQVKIPLDEIAAQNARMLAGEDDQAAIAQHARHWITANQRMVDPWLAAALAVEPTLAAQTADANSPGELAKSAPVLRVATKPIAPFVIYDVQNHQYTGFSIELWQRIAEEAGFVYELYGVNTIAKLLDEVERGAADLAVAGIGITSQRESYLNFSHAYFESGLQILVPADGEHQWWQSILSLVRGIFSPQFVSIIGLLFLALLLAAHVLWYFEKGTNPEFSAVYWPGIWEAFWWSAVTATTVGYGDKTPRTAAGRVIALIWMFAGLFVLAAFTAGVATNFALEEVAGHITGPEDLHNKRVGTVERSTAAEFLELQGIGAMTFAREQDAYTALLEGTLDAVVYDAPVLQHYVATEGAGRAQTAGLIFQQQRYGVALPAASPYEEEINLALLRLVERGEYQTLYEKWFGMEQ